jgi:glycosyltransferase involved in cell wall biosynthesis
MDAVRSMDHVRFLCLSEQLKTMLINKFGIPESRVTNTGYGVDTRFFRPAKDSSFSKPLIVSAGAANRDYRTFVNAVETLDVDVKIAADSAWCPTVIDIDSDRLPPHIEVHSQGDYYRLRELYAKASFIVVPLLPAPFACGYAVIAEAMAMGKAVIATQTESHSDFVIDGETGYYVRPVDVQDLREKIEYLLAHPALAREMGQRARLRIEQNFSVEKYCERLERASQVSSG